MCSGTGSVPASPALTCRWSTRDPVKMLMDRWGCPALLTAVGVDTWSEGAGSSFTPSSASHESLQDASSGGLGLAAPPAERPDACMRPVALVRAICRRELCSYCPSRLRSVASYRWQQAYIREAARSTTCGSCRNRIRSDHRQEPRRADRDLEDAHSAVSRLARLDTSLVHCRRTICVTIVRSLSHETRHATC